MHARPDRKPAHVHNHVQGVPPLFHRPANPAVAAGQLQSGRGKAHRAQPPVFGLDQIAHLASHQRPMAARVFANHHLVPDPHVLLTAHQDQRQSKNLTRLGGHAHWIGHRRRQSLGHARPGLALRFRKREVARRFQFPQRLQAAIALRVATRNVEVEFLAQEIGQLGPVDELAAVIEQPGNIRNGRRLRKRPLDLVLHKHTKSMRRAKQIVQHYLRVTGRANPLEIAGPHFPLTAVE